MASYHGLMTELLHVKVRSRLEKWLEIDRIGPCCQIVEFRFYFADNEYGLESFEQKSDINEGLENGSQWTDVTS